MTNAEHIRSLNDEELSKFITKVKRRAAFAQYIGNREALNQLCSKNWLKQEYIEVKND